MCTITSPPLYGKERRLRTRILSGLKAIISKGKFRKPHHSPIGLRRTSTMNQNTEKVMQQIAAPGKAMIWTIGHSNRSIDKFVDLLQEYKIETLVDVRSFPTSKIEHFKRERMDQWLPGHGIDYTWLGKELGGYRRGGYKAHMKTKLFNDGIKKLLEIAKQKRTSIMCMEPNPKYCHRRFISAHLERKGIEVIHILKKGQTSLISFKNTIEKTT